MSMSMRMGESEDLRLRWHVMAWRPSADDVLGRGFGKGNRGWANVESTLH